MVLRRLGRAIVGSAAIALATAVAMPATILPAAVTVAGAPAAAVTRPALTRPIVTRPVVKGPAVAVAPAAAGPTGTVAVAASPCADPAAAWLGARWREPLRWRFNPASVPAYLGSPGQVHQVIAQAAHRVAIGDNGCGMGIDPAMAQRYDGRTAAVAGVTRDGGCATRNGVNEVTFGALDPGLLAVTCVWWRPATRRADGRIVETDMLFSDRADLFFVGTTAGCRDRWDLAGVATHEFGHAFGLGHVDAGHHGTLLMSDALAACDTNHRRLGLGDYTMLLSHYG